MLTWGLCVLPPVTDLLASLQVILVIKYWTLLCVGCIVISLASYVIMTSLTQSLWLFKISPKTFPFLCELPVCVGRPGQEGCREGGS